MVLIRRFEEKSAELYAEGKIGGFLHLYIGEEAIAVGACRRCIPPITFSPRTETTVGPLPGAWTPDG
jgi:TPP-dependent pyruvate/acetoin dehydrogenase alpha subunit